MYVCFGIWVSRLIICCSCQSTWSIYRVGAGVTGNEKEPEYERSRNGAGAWFCGRVVLHKDTARATNSLSRRQNPAPSCGTPEEGDRNEHTDWTQQTAATPTLCSESKSCHTCQFTAPKKICLLIWQMFFLSSWKGSSSIKSNINISQLSEGRTALPEHHPLHGKLDTASYSCNTLGILMQTCLAFVT